MRLWLVAGFVLGVIAGLMAPIETVRAQYSLDISLEDYLAEVGPDAKLVAAGKLVIDGHRMRCGRRPTVMNPKFDSWGGAYPGFVILNTKRMSSSIVFVMSDSSIKLISISSCVNSGWRSARRSSSRKQRTIW